MGQMFLQVVFQFGGSAGAFDGNEKNIRTNSQMGRDHSPAAETLPKSVTIF